jgi:DNA helicase-2/ATP-dependent DNA helicase PcrA
MQFLSGFFAMHSDRIADQTFIDKDSDAVDILTVHQAKGLQYSTVFLPMLCEDRFPNEVDTKKLFIDSQDFDAKRYLGTLDDERRLFYVAVTRAADSLYVSYARDVGLKKPKNPSIFYNELKESDLESEKQSIDSIHSSALPLVTSYSSLELYLSCPFRYKLSKIYGIATPPNPFYEFGRTLHQVLRYIHDEYKKGVIIHPSEVEKIYDSYFKLRLYVPKVTIMMRKRAGINAITRYINERKDWLNQTMATEKDFSLLLSNTVLKGRLDLLLGSENNCQIIDYKTGNRHAYIDTRFQVGLYAIVGKKHFNYDVKTCKIYYIEHDEIVNYDVNQNLLDDTLNKFNRVVNGVRNSEFNPIPGEVCKRCEYSKICPHKL